MSECIYLAKSLCTLFRMINRRRKKPLRKRGRNDKQTGLLVLMFSCAVWKIKNFFLSPENLWIYQRNLLNEIYKFINWSIERKIKKDSGQFIELSVSMVATLQNLFEYEKGQDIRNFWDWKTDQIEIDLCLNMQNNTILNSSVGSTTSIFKKDLH